MQRATTGSESGFCREHFEKNLQDKSMDLVWTSYYTANRDRYRLISADTSGDIKGVRVSLDVSRYHENVG